MLYWIPGVINLSKNLGSNGYIEQEKTKDLRFQTGMLVQVKSLSTKYRETQLVFSSRVGHTRT